MSSRAARVVRNAVRLATHPVMAWDYAGYQWSRLWHGGRAERRYRGGIRLTGFSGFSEYHSSGSFVGRREQRFLNEYPVGAGDLVDVGANLGLVTVMLGKRFPARRVHAFEPNRTTYEALMENVALNGLTNVVAQRCAVAAEEGEVLFRSDPIARGTTSIARGDGEGVERVRSRSLDSYAEEQGIEAIALLKVDVEGYETLVFRGARELLGSGRVGLVYYEVCPAVTRAAGFEAGEPTRILQGHGYRIMELGVGGKLERVDAGRVESVELENWVGVKG
jgi:FkbM family methyltransferase